MPTSTGVAAQFDFPLHPNFAIGGLMGLRFWTNGFLQSEHIDGATLFDLNAVPTGRWVFSRTGTNLFVAMPLGLTFNWLDSDSFASHVEVSPNLGFNIGLYAGIEVMFGRVFGFRFELGYHYHATSTQLSTADESFGVDSGNSEIASSLGLVFAF